MIIKWYAPKSLIIKSSIIKDAKKSRKGLIIKLKISSIKSIHNSQKS